MDNKGDSRIVEKFLEDNNLSFLASGKSGSRKN